MNSRDRAGNHADLLLPTLPYNSFAFKFLSRAPPLLVCMHFCNLINTVYCKRFDLITSPRPKNIWLFVIIFLCPSSLRHWQLCTPFRLLSTYTRPPYPGATPSPPFSFSTVTHSTICAHSRCLRSFALHYTSSLPVRILAACAHTPPQINNRVDSKESTQFIFHQHLCQTAL